MRFSNEQANQTNQEQDKSTKTNSRLGRLALAGSLLVATVGCGGGRTVDPYDELKANLEEAEATCLALAGGQECVTQGDLAEALADYEPQDIGCQLLLKDRGLWDDPFASGLQRLQDRDNHDFECRLLPGAEATSDSS